MVIGSETVTMWQGDGDGNLGYVVLNHERLADRHLGRFLYRRCKLDNLPTLFTGNPFHTFSEVFRYVELDYFCHSYPRLRF